MNHRSPIDSKDRSAPSRADRSRDGRTRPGRLRSRRRGLSLLEIMIATTILLASVMALSRLAFLARRHVVGAEDKTAAQIHCQNILDEILAGIRPLENVSAESFEGGLWVYSVDIQELESLPLLAVAVTVDRVDDESEVFTTESQPAGYRLVRWIRSRGRSFDPDGMGDEFAEPDEGMGDDTMSADQPFDPDVDL